MPTTEYTLDVDNRDLITDRRDEDVLKDHRRTNIILRGLVICEHVGDLNGGMCKLTSGVQNIWTILHQCERVMSHAKRFIDVNDSVCDPHVMLDTDMTPLTVDTFDCDQAVFGYVTTDREDMDLVTSEKFRWMWPTIVDRRQQLGRVLDRSDLADYENWDQKPLTDSESDVTDK